MKYNLNIQLFAGELEQTHRADMLVFLKTTPGEFSLVGMGIEDQMLSFNSQTDTKGYIHQRASTTTHTGYEPQLNAPTDGWKGDAVFDYVDNLAIEFATGDKLNTEVLIVYPYRDNVATKHDAVIVINEKGGPHGGMITLDYDIHLNGDPVMGTAVVDTEANTATFTKDGDA